MDRGSYVTVELARFSDLKSMGGVDTRAAAERARTWAVAADELAAKSDFGTRRAFTWLGLGLHDDERSASELFDAGGDAMP